jgi:hypothetical protein
LAFDFCPLRLVDLLALAAFSALGLGRPLFLVLLPEDLGLERFF